MARYVNPKRWREYVGWDKVNEPASVSAVRAPEIKTGSCKDLLDEKIFLNTTAKAAAAPRPRQPSTICWPVLGSFAAAQKTER